MVLVTNEFCVVLYVKGQRLATLSPDIGLGIVKYIHIYIYIYIYIYTYTHIKENEQEYEGRFIINLVLGI